MAQEQSLATALPELLEVNKEVSVLVEQLEAAISNSNADEESHLMSEQSSSADLPQGISATEDHRISLIDRIDQLRQLLLTPRETLLQGASFSSFMALHAI